MSGSSQGVGLNHCSYHYWDLVSEINNNKYSENTKFTKSIKEKSSVESQWEGSDVHSSKRKIWNKLTDKTKTKGTKALNPRSPLQTGMGSGAPES